jgi:hypothetical protein
LTHLPGTHSWRAYNRREYKVNQSRIRVPIRLKISPVYTPTPSYGTLSAVVIGLKVDVGRQGLAGGKFTVLGMSNNWTPSKMAFEIMCSNNPHGRYEHRWSADFKVMAHGITLSWRFARVSPGGVLCFVYDESQ